MKTMKAKVCVMMVMSLLSVTALLGQAAQKDRPIAEKIEMKTHLAGAPIVPSSSAPPNGTALYYQDGASTRFSVFVSSMGLADGTTLLVLADDNLIGKLYIFNGEGELELNSLKGDLVPAMKLGSAVVISDPAGKTMLAGVF